ncbi:MAG: hypothetical protein AAGK66_06065, partial [Pseudomonadota bacterium]
MGVVQVETFDVDVTSEGQAYALTNTLPSTASAFVRNTNPRGHSGGPVGSTGNSGPDDMSGYAYVSSASQLMLGRQLGTHKVAGEVWRYTGAAAGLDEFIVRDRVQVTLTNAGPATSTVSGVVDRNRCICFITGKTCSQANQNSTAEMGAIAYLDANGDLVVERGSGSSTLVVYVTIVEFTGANWTVAYARTIFGSGSRNLYLDSTGTSGAAPNIDWTSAFFAEVRQSGGNGSNDAIEDMSFVCEPSGSSSFTQTKDSSAANTGAGFVYVLQNGGMNVSRATASKTIPNNNSYVTETFPAGASLPDAAEACLEWMVFSDGTGTAHGRGSLNARLINATTIQSWVHRSGNAGTYRYGVIDLSGVQGVAPVQITSAPTQMDLGDTDLTISGSNFKAVQGSGAVYVSDTPLINTGTNVLQPIDTWSDTAIQFDVELTGLSDGRVYIIVQNSDGGTSSWQATKGVPSYTDVILGLLNQPDHYHTFDNTYADEIGGLSANGQNSSGTQGFFLEPLSRGRTHSWGVTGNSSRIEMVDSPFTNVTNTHRRRFIGGWFRFPSVPLDPKGIWEEGGNVNNIYMVIGFGGKLLCNVADSSNGFKIQAFSDFLLSPNRAYHIGLLFGGTADDNGCFCFIDGVLQSGTDGTPTSLAQATHSGDFAYGQPDGSLDTGGTDIQYPSFSGSRYNDWGSWSSTGNNPPPSSDIRRELFEKGAVEVVEILSDTPAAMQTAIDALTGADYADVPLAIRVNKPTGASDLALSFDGITFGARTSLHVLWMGTNGSTLTITNRNGSNADEAICSAPYGGAVAVINPAVLTLTGIETGTEVRVYEAGTTNEIAGQESVTTGAFSASVEVSSVDIVIHALGFLNQRL